MSFKDLDDDEWKDDVKNDGLRHGSGNGGMSTREKGHSSVQNGSNSGSDTLAAAQIAIEKFGVRTAFVEEAVPLLGRLDDTPELRRSVQQGITLAMESANHTTDCLQNLFSDCNKSGRQNPEADVKLLMYRKLNKDFEKTFEHLNNLIQKVASAPALPAVKETRRTKFAGADDSSESLLSNDMTQSLLQSTIEFNQRGLDDREREFRAMKQSALHLNEVYNHVAVLVDRQGDDVRNVEHQLSNAEERTNAGVEQLQKSSLYRRKLNPFTLWFFIIIVCGLTTLIIIVATRQPSDDNERHDNPVLFWQTFRRLV